jgi:hypothetical protein
MMGQVNAGVYTPRNLSLYAYAFNHPLNYNDPSGMCTRGAMVVWGGLALADSPMVPVGDIVGGVLVAGDCLIRVTKAVGPMIVGVIVGKTIIEHDPSDNTVSTPIDGEGPTRTDETVPDDPTGGIVEGEEEPSALTEPESLPIDEGANQPDIVTSSALNEEGGLEIDGAGKVHGDLPNPSEIRDDQLENSIEALRQSIAAREAENANHGEHSEKGPQHRRRIEEERALKRSLEKRYQDKYGVPYE